MLPGQRWNQGFLNFDWFGANFSLTRNGIVCASVTSVLFCYLCFVEPKLIGFGRQSGLKLNVISYFLPYHLYSRKQQEYDEFVEKNRELRWDIITLSGKQIQSLIIKIPLILLVNSRSRLHQLKEEDAHLDLQLASAEAK